MGGVSERREHPRADICTTAIVLARHNAGVSFTIESISLGGARLAGPLTLASGERIQLLFEIDGRPIEVFGDVIRVDRQDINTDHIAVKFVELTAETRELIRDLVRRTLELEG
jgi:hypothetical protein